MAHLAEILQQGILQLNLNIAAVAQQKMLEYVFLLIKWNKIYNLTAIRTPREIIVRHLLDSLAVVLYIQGGKILDIGTGAGLPGIPLALALPNKQFYLLDSNNKKIKFLTYIKAILQIKNITIIHSRIEKYQPDIAFSTLITRAFAPLPKIIANTKHLLTEHNILLALTGKILPQVIGDLSPNIQVEFFNVPFLQEERHAYIVSYK